MSTRATVAPHDKEAEVAVLGAVLQDPDLIDRLPRPADFFISVHNKIAEAIRTVSGKGLQVDPRSVADYLVDMKQLQAIGGAVALFDLVEMVPTTANFVHYARKVREKAQARRLIEACTRAAERARNNGTLAGDVAAYLWDEIRDLERAVDGAGPVLVNLGSVAPERIAWVWDARLAFGKISLLVGDPGGGKTYLTMDMAARLSRHGVWPDGTSAPLCNVIALTAEDGLADTLRPRIDHQDGDPERVSVLMGVGDPQRPGSFSLATDLSHLETAILRTGARFVIIDPLSAYLGAETNSHRDSDIRGVLVPLAKLAERHRVAVLGILHLNKNEAQKALYRVSGSTAYVATARAVFLVDKDKGDPAKRLFLAMKMNLGPTPPALAFRIDGDGLHWEDGPVDVDVDDILAGDAANADRSEREYAKEFLAGILGNGRVRVEDIMAQAKQAIIAERTLRRAKADLNVRAVHEGFTGPWFWELPSKVAT